MERGRPTDAAKLREAVGEADLSTLFAIMSAGKRHLLVAAVWRVDVNDGEIFNTPFQDPVLDEGPIAYLSGRHRSGAIASSCSSADPRLANQHRIADVDRIGERQRPVHV